MSFSEKQEMPTAAQEIMAGTFSGVCDALVSHPLDQVKTQFHINQGHNASVLRAMRVQMQEGGIFRLYRGILAACTRQQAICMYTGNEWSKRIVAGSSGELSVPGAYLAGGLTGYLEAACVTPFELVKVRMQSLEHVAKYRSSIDCAAAVVREEGFVALYNGFGASCWRNCTFNGIYFGFINQVKAQAPLPQPSNPTETVAQDLSIGMMAGFVATCFKMPFDVAKSRLMNQRPPEPGMRPQFRHTLQCIHHTWRHEGVGALYKGFSPTAMRIVLGTGVAYAAFEWALGQLSSL